MEDRPLFAKLSLLGVSLVSVLDCGNRDRARRHYARTRRAA
ncbi:hypothetical protein OG746_24305 [Streptomyces sp. NBC_01016]|nr:hypothetical protein [Streptomyces sp. NBC_01016]MCX4831866.1 hypothetical protein [Streptomyces sp. NBC_01016]